LLTVSLGEDQTLGKYKKGENFGWKEIKMQRYLTVFAIAIQLAASYPNNLPALDIIPTKGTISRR
jgi:hypothetical protein